MYTHYLVYYFFPFVAVSTYVLHFHIILFKKGYGIGFYWVFFSFFKKFFQTTIIYSLNQNKKKQIEGIKGWTELKLPKISLPIQK